MFPDFIRDGLVVLLEIMEDVVNEDNPDMAFQLFQNREELLDSDTS